MFHCNLNPSIIIENGRILDYTLLKFGALSRVLTFNRSSYKFIPINVPTLKIMDKKYK